MRIRCACFVAAFLCFGAQVLPAAPQDYSKEAYVVESFSRELTFSADGTGQREQSIVVRVQSDAGVRAFGVLEIQFTADNERAELVYARVRKQDGTVVETPQANVQDVSSELAKAAPTYTDIREKQIPVKGLAAGDVLEYRMRWIQTKPQVPGHFWLATGFLDDGVVLEETLRITVPTDKYVYVKSASAKPEVREEGGRKTYLWRTSRLEPTGSKEVKKKAPQIPEIPAVQLTTFASWEEVGNWYGPLVQSRAVVTPAIQSKAAELTQALTTALEKQKAIYRYVSSKFRYIEIAFGSGRYDPHPAAEVLANGYGDCKDKHTLLAALLRAVGIEAWPALIVAGGKLDPDVPSPGQFNHLITVVPQHHGVVWLDTTPEVAPYGLLLPSLRDQRALVIPDGDVPAALMTTDADPPFPAVQTVTVKGNLDAGGTLTAHFDFTLRGDTEVVLRSAFHQTPPTSWPELAQRLANLQGFGGTVSNLDVENMEDTEKPFHFLYDYVRKSYSDWENRRISPPLPMLLLLYGDEKPVEPTFVGMPGEIVYRTTVRLPDGYSTQVPLGVNIHTSFGDFTSSYSAANGVFTAERRLVRTKSKVPVSAWPEYTKLADAIAEDRDAHAQLTTDSGAKNEAEAQELIGKTEAALQSGRLDETEKNLARTAQLNPKQYGLWLNYAIFHVMKQQPDIAIEDLRKEIANHPENGDAYRFLAVIGYGRPTEASAAWLVVARLYPFSDAARHFWQLYAGGNLAEAIVQLRTALKTAPESTPIQALLAEALLRTGETAEAQTSLSRIGADPSQSASLLGAAFVLADAELDLPRAKEFAEKAVRYLENESRSLDLSSLSAQDVSRGTLLSVAWDTLGWVCFRLGDLDKAEMYIRASWMLSQRPEAGLHLGQIYEQRGREDEASHVYRLVMADPSRVRGEAGERLMNISTQDDPAVVATSMQPSVLTAELEALRTFDVPGPPMMDGSAAFLVVLSSGKIQDALYTSGSDSMKAVRKALLEAHSNVPFPAGSPARVVRSGSLTCSNPKPPACRFTFRIPPNADEPH